MRPLICETVTGQSMAELVAARDRCVHGDMVELRVDGVTDLDVAGALKARTRPVIVTCRPVWEGGRFDGPEETRRLVLEHALQLGADYIDVEWRGGFDDLVRANRDRVVLSSHDFDGVPAKLDERVREMRSKQTAFIKIAVMPSRLMDLLPLQEIGLEGRAIVIGMGGTGLSSRLLAARFGSAWSYAGDAAAPGQITASRMRDEFNFLSVGAATKVYGVVGNNVTHSLSPVMHNAAFAAAGLDAVYVPLLPADFADFMEFAQTFGVEGASVTIPFKLDAIKASVQTDAQARRAGAANTLKRTRGGFESTNTDIDGFLAPLDQLYAKGLTGLRASVLGAGGSARAAVIGLLARGASVTVHARRQQPAEAIASEFGVTAGPWPVQADSWDLLINCTPEGSASAPDRSPLPGGPFTGTTVYDLTYRPPQQGLSPLLHEARAAGCRTLDGLPMLIAQAERQFQWWTDMAVPSGVMADAITRRLSHTVQG